MCGRIIYLNGKKESLLLSLFLSFHADAPNFALHFLEKNKCNLNPTDFLSTVGKLKTLYSWTEEERF